ncbi:MAG: hypothetical protein Q7I94_07880, partial [Candidatus Contubernalis sp.]|nr:hypothetical protein [Candidatus Contubernalis sp.]
MFPNQIMNPRLLVKAPGGLLRKGILFWKSLSTFGKAGMTIILAMVILAVGAPVFTWLPHNLSSGPALAPPGGQHL